MVHFILVFLLLFVTTIKAGQTDCHGDYMYTHLNYSPGEITVSTRDQKFVKKITLPFNISEFKIYNSILYGFAHQANTVCLLNLDSHTLTATLTLAGQIRKMTCYKGRGYIVYKDIPKLTVVDLATHSVIKTLSTSLIDPPEFIEFNSTHLFLARYDEGDVEMIDLKTLEVVHTFSCDDVSDGKSVIDSIQLVQEVPWIMATDDSQDQFVGYQLFLETKEIGPKIVFFQDTISTNVFGIRNPISAIVATQPDRTVNKNGYGNVVFFMPPIAYVFNKGSKNMDVIDLKSGRKVTQFVEILIEKSFKFSATHLFIDDKLVMPLYPSVPIFKIMLKENKLGDYAIHSGGRLKKPTASQERTLSDEDKAFYAGLSKVAALCQEQIYLYLFPIEALYALTQTTENGFLNSVQWAEIRKGILRQICQSLWCKKREKAEAYLALLTVLKDPAVDIFAE